MNQIELFMGIGNTQPPSVASIAYAVSCYFRMKHVEAANEQNAIEILLITDDLFR